MASANAVVSEPRDLSRRMQLAGYHVGPVLLHDRRGGRVPR